MRGVATSLGPWVLASVAACSGGSTEPCEDPDSGLPRETRNDTAGNGELDLLFVVSNAPSMAQEQAALQAQLPAMLRHVMQPPGPGRSGAPVPNAHVGIVTADLGAGGHAWPGCGGEGDGAVLQRGGCGVDAPAFVDYVPPGPENHPLRPSSTQTIDEVVDALACRAAPGADGCGFTQPLEAALQAVWPPPPGGPAHEVTFGLDGESSGRGDGDNQGLLSGYTPWRGQPVLGVVVITDQDDCSVADAALFDPEDSRAQEPAVRCIERTDALHDLKRYLDGLRALPTHHVVLSVIAGVPEDRVVTPEPGKGPEPGYYGSILADSRMQARTEVVDGVARVADVCQSDVARAQPARRLTQLVAELDEYPHQSASLHSICSDDWTPALDRVLLETRTLLGYFARPRDIPRGTDGRIDCDTVWELPPPELVLSDEPTACEDEPFLLPDMLRPVGDRGGVRCVVHQLAVTGLPDEPELSEGEGWFWDDFSDVQTCHTITNGDTGHCSEAFFTPAVQARAGSRVFITLECDRDRACTE